MSRVTKLSPEEREARRARDRKRLEEATRELLSSGGWQRWIALRRQNGLSRYSACNQFLLVAEAYAREIELTYVAGYRHWQKLGYQVRKGEKALHVLAPIRRKVREEESGEEERRVVGFSSAAVFDRSQVDPGPDAVPLDPPTSEPLTGSTHAHLLDRLEAFASEIGGRVSYEEAMPGEAKGFYRRSDKLIAIGPDEPNAQVRTLLHELAHALVAREDVSLSYAEEECVVECAGHVAASSAGLDTSSEAISYCASWGEKDDLEAVTQAAELIDRLAKRLEDAIEPEDEKANTE